jgi:hypothetical protein
MRKQPFKKNTNVQLFVKMVAWFLLLIFQRAKELKKSNHMHGSKSLLQTTQVIASPRILFYEKPLHDVPNTVQGG